MNKYQRQKSKEIKQIMKFDKFAVITYSQARVIWKLAHKNPSERRQHERDSIPG